MSTLDFHLYSSYTGELNFGQTIWDKTQVLLGTSSGTHLGTLREPFGNMLGTHWEQGEKNKKKSLVPSPSPQLPIYFTGQLHVILS
jgi:hypothetical protein